jgi:hypothetical protein
MREAAKIYLSGSNRAMNRIIECITTRSMAANRNIVAIFEEYGVPRVRKGPELREGVSQCPQSSR